VTNIIRYFQVLIHYKLISLISIRLENSVEKLKKLSTHVRLRLVFFAKMAFQEVEEQPHLVDLLDQEPETVSQSRYNNHVYWFAYYLSYFMQ